MTLFLASVRDADEAEIALEGGADIIDLKEPSRGALGAVALAQIGAAVRRVNGQAPVSATIGDLAMESAGVADAIGATASCGVDYVKLGLFQQGEAAAGFAALAPLARDIRLILVIFADRLPTFDPVDAAARAGFHGVMLDTADKSAGALPDLLDHATIASFVTSAQAEGLLVGLAGSLRHHDIPALLRLSPHLLGFRGALCHNGARGEALDPTALLAVRSAIPRQPPLSNALPTPIVAAEPHRALC